MGSLKKIIEQGKETARTYINSNFTDHPLSEIIIPEEYRKEYRKEDKKEDKKEEKPLGFQLVECDKNLRGLSCNPRYFACGQDVYVLKEAPRGYRDQNLFVLKKVVLNKPYNREDIIKNYRFYHFDSLSDERIKMGCDDKTGNDLFLIVEGFLDKQDYDQLINKIKIFN